ncbi:MAG: hypothetical protein NZL95_00405 [Chitinophagales bacterium]|nr:hypothetical protein [Chitinophagales bacterium]MDW8427000.1 hypothetical protein [Chitinophagales bacterium]
MKTIAFACVLLLLLPLAGTAQDLILGLGPHETASVVKKSSRTPTVRLRDGSLLTVSYRENLGFKVTWTKNAKTFALADSLTNALMVQAAEKDIDGDGKHEVIIAAKITDDNIEVTVFRKPEFETYYQRWSSFTAVAAVEFPGDNTVKIYDLNGKAGTYRFDRHGKLTELP